MIENILKILVALITCINIISNTSKKTIFELIQSNVMHYDFKRVFIFHLKIAIVAFKSKM